VFVRQILLSHYISHVFGCVNITYVESPSRGLSIEGGLGIAIGLLSLLVPADSPTWRVVILVASCILIGDTVRKTGWVKEKNRVLSIIEDVAPNEPNSFLRELLAFLLVAFVIATYGFITWPSKNPEKSSPPQEVYVLSQSVPLTEHHATTPNEILHPNIIPVAPLSKPIPPQKPKSKPTPQPSTPIINSPDPYVGVSDSQVAEWAIQEADRLEKDSRTCISNEVDAANGKGVGALPAGSVTREMIEFRFFGYFRDGLKPAIIKLHDSLVFRLGPAFLNSEEESSYEEMMRDSDSPNSSTLLCMEVQSYASYLRIMGQRLKNQY
jgi:hypothetical protein